MAILQQIHQNAGVYLEIFGAFTAFFTLLATVTPSKKDDKVASVLDRVGSIADRLGIQFKVKKEF
jgi:hypothetical protein